MRTFAISVLMALALAACSAPTSSPPEEAAPAPTEEASNGQGTPIEPAPEAPMAEAPATEDAAGNNELAAPPPPPPPPPPPSPAPRYESAPPAATAPAAPPRPAARTRSIPRPTATPVIVEIDRTQDRRPANGGSSVLLFSDGAANANRNLTTCTNVWSLMDTATTQEVRVGIRKADDGTVEALRPLYWLKTSAASAGATCAQRMATYDFARARTIRDKYRLSGAGPYFIVARTDEQAAAIVDLSGRSNSEIADLVRYFRDGFAFQNDIWDPARNDPAKKRAVLASFFGSRFRESLVASLGFVSSPASRAGCRLGDLRDAPCT